MRLWLDVNKEQHVSEKYSTSRANELEIVNGLQKCSL
jgi:hypothetical protein